MVWVVLARSHGFGRYFPEGDFVNWDGEYETFQKLAFRDRGKPLPQEWPKAYKIKKNIHNLADIINLTGQVLVVSSALKDVIDTIEPDVHYFNPIPLTYWKGEPVEGEWYVMVIGRFLDSFVAEKSEFVRYYEDTNTFQIRDTKSDIVKLSFDSSVFGNAHLWRETRLGEIVISDQLRDALAAADLTIFKHCKAQEV